MRGTQPGLKLLRDELKYNKKFYYVCIVLNTIFRFWWLLGAITIHYTGQTMAWQYFEIMFFISMMVEMVRRTLWALIRVENEFFHNFEQYRSIITIPPIRDEAKFVKIDR